MVTQLANALSRAGVWADVERVQPSLYKYDSDGKLIEARLDIQARVPGGSTWLIDVTISSAFCKSLQVRLWSVGSPYILAQLVRSTPKPFAATLNPSQQPQTPRRNETLKPHDHVQCAKINTSKSTEYCQP